MAKNLHHIVVPLRQPVLIVKKEWSDLNNMRRCCFCHLMAAGEEERPNHQVHFKSEKMSLSAVLWSFSGNHLGLSLQRAGELHFLCFEWPTDARDAVRNERESPSQCCDEKYL